MLVNRPSSAHKRLSVFPLRRGTRSVNRMTGPTASRSPAGGPYPLGPMEVAAQVPCVRFGDLPDGVLDCWLVNPLPVVPVDIQSLFAWHAGIGFARVARGVKVRGGRICRRADTGSGSWTAWRAHRRLPVGVLIARRHAIGDHGMRGVKFHGVRSAGEQTGTYGRPDEHITTRP
jgi:hypothetical protein